MFPKQAQKEALSGLTVLEFTEYIAGPYCGKLLGCFGADVIKIEDPDGGNWGRRVAIFSKEETHPEDSGVFLCLNINKTGITLNLRSSLGKRILRELISQSDILIEDCSPSVSKELGIDYDTLNAVNPGLIVTSITPFGQNGPYRDYKGTDLIYCNMSGLARITPNWVKEPSRMPPLRPGGHQAEYGAGATAAVATLCAVLARQATGRGQHVDVSKLEAITSAVRQEISFYTYDSEGEYQKLYATRNGKRLPFDYIRCKDGYVILGLREEYQWRGFLEMMLGPDYMEDEQVRSLFNWEGQWDLYAVGFNWDKLVDWIEEWAKKYTRKEIYEKAQERRLPVAPCNQVDDLFKSAQLKARGFFVEVDRPATGKLPYPGAPVIMGETPWQVKRPAPRLGEHNLDVLGGRLGYSKEDIVKFSERGII